MDESIHGLTTAEPGWRAFYTGELLGDTESARVVAWALVDRGEDGMEVVGMVVSPDDPTRIVPAPDAASVLAPDFERYGFRDDDS
jgi:hypothetical protein